MYFTKTQIKALATAPKVASVLSILGSSLILKEVLFVNQWKLSRPFYRLLLGLSTVDFLSSIFFFLSTWPIPKGTPSTVWASGTVQTCSLQGFFLQLSVAAPMYNACIAVFHLLQIRYNCKREALLRWEKLSHASTWTFWIVSALICLYFQAFNSAHVWCWIDSIPFNCQDEIERGERTRCDRGHNAWRFRLVFGFIPLLSSLLIGCASMVLVYRSVLQTESKMKKYSFEDNRQQRRRERRLSRKYSKRVGMQGIYYIVACFLAWFPAILARVVQFVPQHHATWHFSLAFLKILLNPMQGFFNFFVYFGPRYWKYTLAHPPASCCKYFKVAFRMVFCGDDLRQQEGEEESGDLDHRQQENQAQEYREQCVESQSHSRPTEESISGEVIE